MKERRSGVICLLCGVLVLLAAGSYGLCYPFEEGGWFVSLVYPLGEVLARGFMGVGIYVEGLILVGLGIWQIVRPETKMVGLLGLGSVVSFLFSMLVTYVPVADRSCFADGYGGILIGSIVTFLGSAIGALALFILLLVLLLGTVVYGLRQLLNVNVSDLEQVSFPVSDPKKKSSPKPRKKTVKKPAVEEMPVNIPESIPGKKKVAGTIDPKEDVKDFENPPVSILEKYADKIHSTSKAEIADRKDVILDVLNDYNVALDRIEAISGPTVTLFKLFPAKKVKVQSVLGRYKEIKLGLKAEHMNMDLLADSVGLEVPNAVRSVVPLRNMLESEEFKTFKGALPVAVGYTVDMRPRIIDLAKAPHLLIAGTTGGGKSVSMHSIIMSLLYSKHPTELKLVLIDPKLGTEFGCYRALASHFLALLPEAGSEQEEQDRSIVTNRKTADKTLRALRKEMDDRYALFDKAGVSKIDEYNAKYCNRTLLPTEGHHFLPFIVVVIDEFGDLIQRGKNREETDLGRNINATLIGLSALGRAAGIHLVIATQSPKAEVITSQIRNNFPWQMALMCKDGTQSRVIMDALGAEHLIGNGDMFLCTEKRRERVQGAFVDKPEIHRTVKAISQQKGWRKAPSVPFYLPEVPENENEESGQDTSLDRGKLDPRFEEVARYVVSSQMASTSDLQAQMGLGFPRARKIMSQLQSAGIVGPQNGSRPRDVLVATIDDLETLLRNL